MADAPEVQRLAGSPEVASTTLNVPHPYEDGMAEAWISRHALEFEEKKMLVLAITFGNRLVGAISLRLEPEQRRAELGYWIGRPYWGQGYATEAVAAVLAFGFASLGLNRIQATHVTRNPASGRVMQKAGMLFEGIQREHFWKNGRPETIARYAILATDPRPDAGTAAGPPRRGS